MAAQISASLYTAAAPASALASSKSAISGASVTVQGLPPLSSVRTSRPLRIEANKIKKVNVKLPLGYSKDTKYRNGVDASGSKQKGKGVYQFTKKYGANVDGYSPIYAEEDWAKSGGTYAGGTTGLALWAVTFAGLLAAGAFLVYSTSALSS